MFVAGIDQNQEIINILTKSRFLWPKENFRITRSGLLDLSESDTTGTWQRKKKNLFVKFLLKQMTVLDLIANYHYALIMSWKKKQLKSICEEDEEMCDTYENFTNREESWDLDGDDKMFQKIV